MSLLSRYNPSRSLRTRTAAVALVAVPALILAGTAVGTSSARAAAGCSVSYRVTAQWPGGFGADVMITNFGDAVNGWQLGWTFDAGQTITQIWNATATRSGGSVTATNLSYNATIGTGASTQFGFNGAWSGSNPVPNAFTLNGTACTGPGGGTTTTTTTTTTPVTTTTTVPVTTTTTTPVTTTTTVPVTTTTTTPVTTTTTRLVTTTTTTTGGAAQACDLYAAGGTPCVAAHSTTRALLRSYNGPLYQIQRSSDSHTLDVGLLSAGGYANAAPQQTFCANTRCTITKIYDQTANHNDMPISWGGLWPGPGPNGSDIGADAMALPLTVAGHPAYGVKVTSGVGYRIDHGKGTATGSQAEGMYMVTSSNLVNNQCCFDYGNTEIDHRDDGNATMDSIYFGTACWFNNCVGSGPWVEADLENGMYHTNTGSNKDPNNSGIHYPFVSAWLKNNGTTNFTLKYGNANSGPLVRPYSGPLPNGYNPMKLQGSIGLGTGGDNSRYDQGEFFEGAMTIGFPNDAAEEAVQANIVAANYKF